MLDATNVAIAVGRRSEQSHEGLSEMKAGERGEARRSAEA